MVHLATLHEVKQMLRIDHSEDDLLIDGLLSGVSQSIINYLQSPAWLLPVGEAPVSVPLNVRTAAVLWIDILYRGDDARETQDGRPPRVVETLLWQDRKPALA